MILSMITCGPATGDAPKNGTALKIMRTPERGQADPLNGLAVSLVGVSGCSLIRPTRLTTSPTSGHKPSRATEPDQLRTERDAPAVLFGNERDGKVGTFARARSLVEQASAPGVVTYALAGQQAILGDTREPIASFPELPIGLASTSEAA